MEIPAISVIIPMYNTEKYIGECLDSLLAQTFKNFEVIVVDDCSTDKSLEIVKNYEPKFNGRLKIFKTKANSGGGGYVPRNLGLNLSHGEYIFFVDSDDLIAKDALEKLFNAAKNTKTDVVYTGAYYLHKGIKQIKLIYDGEGNLLLQKRLEDNPVLILDAPDKNFNRLLMSGGWFHMPWTKFVKRNFLIENEIVFPKIISGGDFIWTIQVLYYAKKILRISTPLYFYRDDAFNSITRKKNSPDKQISNCVSAFILGLKSLKELSNRIDLLKNQIYFRSATDSFFYNLIKRTFQERMQLKTQHIYEILYRDFIDEKNFLDLTLPFFFSVIDSQQKNLINLQQQFNNFSVQAQQRISELENEIKRLKGLSK